MRRTLHLVALVAAAVLVPGCFLRPANLFEVVSTDGPVGIEFSDAPGRSAVTSRFLVDGVTQVDLSPTTDGGTECETTYPLLSLVVVDQDGAVLHVRDVVTDPVCLGDRLVWTGDDLVELAADEPWPDDVHDTPANPRVVPGRS